MADLTDREAVNRAVAEAIGPPRETQPLRRIMQRWPPDYLGDDPRLNREMWNRLRRECVTLWHECTDDEPDATAHAIGGFLDETNSFSERGATEAEALVRALIAAGVVELPVYIEPKADHGRDRGQEV